MDLNNTFEVSRSIDETWAVLTNVERIAPCLPGAHLQEIEGDEYRGVVKVKVGPITAQYKGAASFVEKNDVDHRAVLDAKGRDTRGAGNAQASITAQLEEVSATVTRVNVETDLKVTGKVAQFGRGVMADVSSKLMGQFADNLEAMLDEEPAATAETSSADTAPTNEVPAAGSASDPTDPTEPTPITNAPSAGPAGPSAARRIDMPEPEAIDLFEHAGTPVLKRVAPVIAIVVLVLILRRLLRSN